MNTDSWHNLSEEVWESCYAFSQAEFSGTRAIRDQRAEGSVPDEKLWLDILRGKCAEFIAQQMFQARGFHEVTAPDLKIYPKSQKSFKADLHIGDTEIHVKSCTPEDGKDPSWLFQKKEDPLVTHPQANQLLCFVYISLDGRKGIIYRLVESTSVFPKLIDKPRSLSKQKSKVAIYQAALEKNL